MLFFTIPRRGGRRLLSSPWLWGVASGLWLTPTWGWAQAHPTPVGAELCTTPALERFTRHRVAPGETLEQIAQRYGLLSTTLMGLNPRLRQGTVTAGWDIAIPPYNGILVSLPPGKTLPDVAKAYGVRADVLFEVNGCQAQPQVVFVPGVNWSPLRHTQPTGIVPFNPSDQQAWQQLSPEARRDRYPLPQEAEIVGFYGWRVNPHTERVDFSSGVDLAAAANTPVYVVADGVVAFVGEQAGGRWVIINHPQGRQTRYAGLDQIRVTTGQSIQRGAPLGVVGAASVLRFELRYRSDLGWVAQDPQPYLRTLARP